MPARLREIVRGLALVGVHVETPNGSSHYKAVRADGRKYTIPAHNGLKTEIGDEYIRALARFLGMTVEDLKAKWE